MRGIAPRWERQGVEEPFPFPLQYDSAGMETKPMETILEFASVSLRKWKLTCLGPGDLDSVFYLL